MGRIEGDDRTATITFANDPVTGAKRRISYNRGLNTTSGEGILVFHELRYGREWQIDLGQPQLNRSGNRINPNGTRVQICRAGDPDNCRQIRLVW
jgi:hypothetical protein